jgi:hypothetical protein
MLTIRPAKKFANKNTHSSNRERGRLRMNSTNTQATQANLSTTFRETDAVQVPLEKGKAATERLAPLLTAHTVFSVKKIWIAIWASVHHQAMTVQVMHQKL